MSDKRIGVALLICASAMLVGCADVDASGDDEAAGGVSLATQPPEGAPLPKVCDLVEEESVAEIFGGRTRGERPGSFPGTCSYTLVDRPGLEVVVSDMGPPREWSRVRRAAADMRDGVDAVHGLEAGAFVPRDAEGREIVVRTKRMIVAISAAGPSTESDLAAKVAELAREVVATARSES